ncbi:hypothetical protein RP20_CCG008688 [Aedes albopictus]|nr:hypothetical protein RP20_CCG008688 [Aedes albopictus]
MADRTAVDAKNFPGTNPRIPSTGRNLAAELLVDKADIRLLGGVFGGNLKPTTFLCLIVKMLLILPEKNIVVEFITRRVQVCSGAWGVLPAAGWFLAGLLQVPGTADNRKLRLQNRMGHFELVHMEGFNELLQEERACDIIFPRIQKQDVLEKNNNELERCRRMRRRKS